ncbi:zinc-dependent metalloprotease [Flavobacterium sp.]
MRIKLLLLAIFFSLSAFSQRINWQKVNLTQIATNKFVQRDNFPLQFDLYQVSTIDLKNSLQQAPNRLHSNSSKVTISIPNLQGKMERFQMFEFSNFDQQLQVQYPEIRSYVGQGIDDKTAVLRLSYDPRGVQGMILRANKETEFFEPYSLDGSVYAFFSSERKTGDLPFVCSTQDITLTKELKRSTNDQSRSSSGELLTFRLALSCNGEYAQFFGGTVDQALAGMNATMTRVNGVFETDLAIHMNIIANNALVIYTNPANDPYSTNLGAWNGQLQNTLTTLIGESNYDIGHMFGASGGGGNAGCIGCVCEDGSKGSGITSPGSGGPIGDTYDIDYVAHEMGHQFGANHSFSHNVEGSGVNVEPGSGSTVMGYAGITSRDVQLHSDAYFVYASINQIQDNMILKTCPERVTLSNIAPIVNAGLDYTIPRSTPFVLNGEASADNASVFSYCWEQNDSAQQGQTGAQSGASPTKTNGPNFRSYTPVSNSYRYFPRIQSIVANQATTSGLEILVEALSSVSRTMNFVLTVRDNYAGSGQTKSDAVEVTVNSAAGPFLVTTPNTATTWTVGTNENIIWNVAGTTENNVNAAYVDIFLSTDGGYTYPIQLASKVPNDGAEMITVPNNIGTTNRIMVKGYKHIFFDISNANFAIIAPISGFSVAYNGVAEQQNKEICTGSSIQYTIPYTAYAGFNGIATFTVSGEPNNSSVTFSPSATSTSQNITMTISTENGSIPALYSMTVTAISGGVTNSAPFYLNLFDSNFSTLTLTTPANEAIGQQTDLNLTWENDTNATLYDVQVATDPDFTSIIATGAVTTNTFAVLNLDSATIYYWRVLPKNNVCSGIYSEANLFKTGQIICADFSSTNVPVTIPTSGNVTVNSTQNVTSTDIISDANVTININHSWINDLKVTLISPAGTQVQLVNRPCTSDSLLNITATFDDSGVPVLCGNNPAISGTVIPVQSLSAFNGESMNGIWTLRVLDSFAQDGGMINGWSLNLCSNTPVSLAINENTLQDFSLYPNPSNGSFTISFNSTSSTKVNVGVFDIRGRMVYQNNYQNNGFFNEIIQLGTLHSGIYLVNVQDGDKQITKKIVIE